MGEIEGFWLWVWGSRVGLSGCGSTLYARAFRAVDRVSPNSLPLAMKRRVILTEQLGFSISEFRG